MIALLLAACTPTPPPDVDAWVVDVARDASAFTTLVEDDRDGWIALHEGKPIAMTDPVGAQRSAIVSWANRRDLRIAGERGVRAMEASVPEIATAKASCAAYDGQPTCADTLDVPSLPAPEDTLGYLFLAPWPSYDALAAASSRTADPGLWGARTPGVPESVSALDDWLDGVQAAVDASEDADGKALVAELGLVARLRQEILVARARQALEDEDPNTALRLADIAWDASASDVGARNPPAIAAVRARALAALGHPRQALDAVQPLVDADPHAAWVRHWLSLWAVQDTLGRDGASHE